MNMNPAEAAIAASCQTRFETVVPNNSNVAKAASALNATIPNIEFGIEPINAPESDSITETQLSIGFMLHAGS